FTTRDGYLYAVRTEGTLVFRTRIGPSTSSPAVGSGIVYAASGVLGTGGNVAAFDLQGDPRWSFTPNGPVQSSLTLAGDRLVFATNTEAGTVYALDAPTGDLVWTYVPEPQQHILPTPVVIDGLVIVASDSGFVYALGAAGPSLVGPETLAAAVVLIAAVVLAVVIFLYVRRLRAT
ncbi:MAG: PQQ-binding-like beta-propeller repeat protein, partial [Thermoplasmata archaeon]